MNGDSEWNRWRGEQTAILELVKKELTETKVALQDLKKEFYIIKGKSALFGAMAGVLASVIILILRNMI